VAPDASLQLEVNVLKLRARRSQLGPLRRGDEIVRAPLGPTPIRLASQPPGAGACFCML
jgi:hypothetical protein